MTKGNIEINEKEMEIEREKMLANIAQARLKTIEYYMKKLTKEEWQVIDVLEKRSQEVQVNRKKTWIEVSQDILTENVVDALVNYFNYRFKKTKDNKRYIKVKEGMNFCLVQKKYGKLF